MAALSTIKNYARSLRHDAVERNGVLVFEPIPLYILAERFVSHDGFVLAVRCACRTRDGDEAVLDPQDPEHVSRMESAILDLTKDLVRLDEILRVELMGRAGVTEVIVCIAAMPESCALVVHVADNLPAFMVVVLGSRESLQKLLEGDVEMVLPRIVDAPPGDVRAVIVREGQRPSWAAVEEIVAALVGVRRLPVPLSPPSREGGGCFSQGSWRSTGTSPVRQQPRL